LTASTGIPPDGLALSGDAVRLRFTCVRMSLRTNCGSVFPLDRMPRVRASQSSVSARDQDAALFKACLEAADELGAALAALRE
jgi:hypothetical protein